MSLPQPLLDALGTTVTRTEALAGGDLSQVARVTLADGRDMVTKRGPLVDAEARMLSAMAHVHAPVPQVRHAEHGLICLDYLPPAPATSAGWRDFGAALARMHSWDGQDYGWTEDYAFGDVRIENAAAASWPAFWGERRLLPFLPHLPAALGARLEALAADLGDRLPASPKPALLHGDLWGGNVHFTDQGAFMIDPACYYGHSEVDLAMLTLFGQPDAAFWRGYGRLEPGFEARRVIYQLFPALVHLRLFGEGYAPMVTGLLDQAGV
ncbi:Fructosamine-3-kinase [Roseivivax lentus]|uniref:Fructosamine-3-kinase n=1 Tax=Roseivivax lentus TaxID=633194 RepID=A0A1N7PJ21_9RHOB|nr:fructosamine kinase family protein [Roseivivax lentus]SIT10614.1 Fructosamine-3-kinase [Roseivivax lentus]